MPAAGASSRMQGRDKLLEDIDGTPLLLRQVRAALNLGLPLLVTLPPSNTARASLLQDATAPNLTQRTVPDAQTGISASLRAGADWAMDHDFDALMVVLPDMPDLTGQDLAQVVHVYRNQPGDVIRATDAGGTFGHPTILPARLFKALLGLTGDHGARDILSDEEIRPCPLPGNKATTDLDTPQAWAAWRAARD